MLGSIGEGVLLAIDALRTNKLRSGLTILGVVIGVSTVMTMASIIEGIETQIMNAVNSASPNTFYVFRYFGTTPVNPENPPYEVRIRPVLRESDAFGNQVALNVSVIYPTKPEMLGNLPMPANRNMMPKHHRASATARDRGSHEQHLPFIINRFHHGVTASRSSLRSTCIKIPCSL